jgi:predicted DNA-binding transcriptional regulator AlpA
MPDRLLTVAEVAAWLALGQAWVREHAAELGAVKTGDDPRSPLRFARRDIEQWIDEHRLQAPIPLSARRTTAAERVKLLPLPDERR